MSDSMAVEASVTAPVPHLLNTHASGAGLKRKAIVESSDEESEDGKVDVDATGDNTLSGGSVVVKEVNGRVSVKPEPVDEESGSSESDESSEDEKPLAKRARTSSNPKPSSKSNANGNGNANGANSTRPTSARSAAKPAPTYADSSNVSSEEDEDEDEIPLAKKTANGSKPSSAKSKAKPEPKSSDESDEDDVPLAKKATAASKRASTSTGSATASKRKPAAAKKPKSESSSEDENTPLSKKARTKQPAASSSARSAKGKAVKQEVKDEKPSRAKAKKEEEDEELYEWWNQQNGNPDGDGTVKWRTLAHNGVLFPPPYQPLPKSVKMEYDGKPLTLKPEAEEVAGFFAALLETDHAKDAKFGENFFRDWKKVLEKEPPSPNIPITDLEKCNFRPMWQYFERQKEIKKAMTTEEKKRVKAEREELEKPYLHCVVDGRKEKIGNFRLEPPGLFRGRGEHPKKGTYKYRLRPEDVVINIGEGEPIPQPNMPGKWKEIRHDQTVTWLAHWKENVNGNSKYVFLSAGSTWKGQSDREKFEKARKLQNYVDVIRRDYSNDLNSKVMADRQRATAMYLIDRLALRAGNEKGEDEADTVGCCSLRLEHVTLIPPSSIELRFLGKDSIMYEQTVEVEPQVFKNIKIFKREPKTEEDDLFDRLTTSSLNKHLSSYMEGLTAKVFRTYNASWTFQQQLENTPKKGTVAEKIAAYNRANKEVAILCNHQKTVSKTHATSMEKLGDKLMLMKYNRMKVRRQLLSLDPGVKKKRKDLTEEESDLDDDAVERCETIMHEQAVDRAKKKFERENQKLQQEKQKPLGAAVLKERLKEIDQEFKELKKERKAKKIEPKKGATTEKLLDSIKKLDERMEAFKISMEDRESNKTVALGTSKILV